MRSIAECAGHPVHDFAIFTAQLLRNAIAAEECTLALTEHDFDSSLDPGHGRFLTSFRGQRREDALSWPPGCLGPLRDASKRGPNSHEESMDNGS